VLVAPRGFVIVVTRKTRFVSVTDRLLVCGANGGAARAVVSASRATGRVPRDWPFPCSLAWPGPSTAITLA